MGLQIRDPRITWIEPIQEACEQRGIRTHVIESANDVTDEDLLFLRPHADPSVMSIDKAIYSLAPACIQDWRQVMWYDDKRAQVEEWKDWMPETFVTTEYEEARAYVESCPLPIVSKADVGASSRNVRVIDSRRALIAHVDKLWHGGIVVEHCDSQGTKSRQKGYVLLQRFIPHDTTYRVNLIGSDRAIFLRHNYPDKPVAQTGNTDPVTDLTPELESLLEYSDRFLAVAETRFCAIDVLKDGDGWKLLETSLCWPWPGVGDGATFFPSGRKWCDMWDVMLDAWADDSYLQS